MEQKKELAKIAIAAFLFAAAAPAHAMIDHGFEAQGTYLAAGCKHHGCSSIADNGSNNNDMYNTRSNSYQMGQTPDSAVQKREMQQNSNPEGNNPEGEIEDLDYVGDNYTPSSYNSQQAGVTPPTYVEDYRQANAPTRRNVQAGGMNNPNRGYNTATDYDYSRRAMPTTAPAATLTEAQLLGMLNPQARNIYLNLDPEGKSLAIQLASQDSYKDKNLAIKEAQRRMNERRGQMHR